MSFIQSIFWNNLKKLCLYFYEEETSSNFHDASGN